MSGRAALSGLVAALALVLGLALPDAARAVCATPVDADERVRAADVAFVGRALERREDRFAFEVVTAVKGVGVAGSVVEVRVGGGGRPPASIDLQPTPGDVLGLVARLVEGVPAATACDVVPRERLEEIVRGEDPCPATRVRALGVRPVVRVTHRYRGREQRFRIRVTGEGRRGCRPPARHAVRRTVRVVLRHQA